MFVCMYMFPGHNASALQAADGESGSSLYIASKHGYADVVGRLIKRIDYLDGENSVSTNRT